MGYHKGYRNCVYDNKTRSVHLWTWDADGNRVKQQLEYKPYLYLEDKAGKERSIYGTTLKRREFDTLWDRNKFVKETRTKRLFENLPPYQQFLIDNYYHCCDDDGFSAHPLKIMFLDIECPGVPGGKFPEPELAENEINLLTCYDSMEKVYKVFGLQPYQPSANNVDYVHCKSEKDLLRKFIRHFSSDYPDCLVGYNSANFDIPYLVNRIINVLDKEWADELSPIGRIYEKVNNDGKFGMPVKQYVIEGISSLDYYVLYKKFSMEPLESYKLDYVAEVELAENKVEYDGSLAELAIKDWKTYVDYNIKDVEILVKLDDKLRHIELLRFIAYLGLCNMENAVRTVPVINGAVAIRARHRDEKIPTFVRPKTEGKIPGGYVAEPKLGFVNSLVSFDANSLYPSVMISLNMSPETKVGSVEKIGDNYLLKHVSGREFELTPQKYVSLIGLEKLAKSKSNILFSQKKKGIMPEFLDFLYSKRKEMKSRMVEMKKNYQEIKDTLTKDEKVEWEKNIQKFDTFQHAYKITLNSTYGYCANKYAPLGDEEIGTSVTLTGQAVIKQSNEIFKEYVKENFPLAYDSCDKYIIYNDTDSYLGDTKIITNRGIFDAENLWNHCSFMEKDISVFGHEIIDVTGHDLKVETFDSTKNIVRFGKVKNLIRHKVKKKKYRIKVDGKEITMTEDHGCMVVRNGELVRVKPCEIVPTDKMVIRR